MKRKCVRCSDKDFEVPDYTQEEKRILSDLKKNKMLGKLFDRIKSLHNISDIDTKFSLMHINKEYGSCNRCNVNYLDKEYITCPKCEALNFNWKIE